MAQPPYLVAFDTETNGVDTEVCRIVTAFIGVYEVATGTWVETWDWLLDIGEDIPQGAIDVHGITNELMREWGTDARLGVFEIMQRLDILQKRGLPFVVMNARYDFTLLDREAERHYPGVRPFEPTAVLDPYVIDKKLAQYRKGKRNLVTLCGVYGVPVEDNAHDAGADCLMASRVAVKQLAQHLIHAMTLEQLHAQQIVWAAQQARGLAAYYRKSGKPTAGIQEAWPIVPRPTNKES
jgi:DNA polymerase-3 subunit epsilon